MGQGLARRSDCWNSKGRGCRESDFALCFTEWIVGLEGSQIDIKASQLFAQALQRNCGAALDLIVIGDKLGKLRKIEVTQHHEPSPGVR